MSKLTAYTIELYKKDKRIKKDELYGRNKVGLRFIDVMDFDSVTKDFIDVVVSDYTKAGYVAKLFETYKIKTNMMSGQKYRERYDTPSFCSPSSESYWSM